MVVVPGYRLVFLFFLYKFVLFFLVVCVVLWVFWLVLGGLVYIYTYIYLR